MGLIKQVIANAWQGSGLSQVVLVHAKGPLESWGFHSPELALHWHTTYNGGFGHLQVLDGAICSETVLWPKSTVHVASNHALMQQCLNGWMLLISTFGYRRQ